MIFGYLLGFREVASFGFKEEDIDQIIKAADSNGNGVIDYSGKDMVVVKWLIFA